jgi:hypothetical protein
MREISWIAAISAGKILPSPTGPESRFAGGSLPDGDEWAAARGFWRLVDPEPFLPMVIPLHWSNLMAKGGAGSPALLDFDGPKPEGLAEWQPVCCRTTAAFSAKKAEIVEVLLVAPAAREV